MVIDSVKHDLIQRARQLTSRAGRIAASRCLLDGPALIAQALSAGATLDYALCAEDGPDDELARELAAARIPVHRVRAGLLAKAAGSTKPVRWLAVPRCRPRSRARRRIPTTS
ncbi:hypothetical protein [Amycolatopsis arida]|uniref:hypothetical protein n=1 Tax=Amycolatopsis arida TaxID=587909 RepID=UPI001416FB80|nr:hypothetical protein [Amycolatopsis arida]